MTVDKIRSLLLHARSNPLTFTPPMGGHFMFRIPSSRCYRARGGCYMFPWYRPHH